MKVMSLLEFLLQETNLELDDIAAVPHTLKCVMLPSFDKFKGVVEQRSVANAGGNSISMELKGSEQFAQDGRIVLDVSVTPTRLVSAATTFKPYVLYVANRRMDYSLEEWLRIQNGLAKVLFK